jgi:hypothetical protein
MLWRRSFWTDLGGLRTMRWLWWWGVDEWIFWGEKSWWGARVRKRRLLSWAAAAICQLMPTSECGRCWNFRGIDRGIESSGTVLSRGPDGGFGGFCWFCFAYGKPVELALTLAHPVQVVITKASAAEDCASLNGLFVNRSHYAVEVLHEAGPRR